MLMSFGLYEPILSESIIVILEYTSTKHVKLLDHRSDLQEPSSTSIFRDFLRHIIWTSWSLFYLHPHAWFLFVFLPFARRKATQPKTTALRKLLQSETSVQPIWTIYCTPTHKADIQWLSMEWVMIKTVNWECLTITHSILDHFGWFLIILTGKPTQVTCMGRHRYGAGTAQDTCRFTIIAQLHPRHWSGPPWQSSRALLAVGVGELLRLVMEGLHRNGHWVLAAPSILGKKVKNGSVMFDSVVRISVSGIVE